MNEFLFHYEKVAPTTWAYLSSLLMIGLFFKFSRFWSVRNLDLALLILLAPGLLLYHYGQEATVPVIADNNKTANQNDARDAEDTAQQGGNAQLNGDAQLNGTDQLPGDDQLVAPTPLVDESVTPDENEIATSETPEADDINLGPASNDEPLEPDLGPATNDETLVPEQYVELTAVTPEQDRQNRGRSAMLYGFIWLFSVGALLLIRMLIDSTMVRRPLLEPNLSTGGLAFIGCSLFVFLMANVISSVPTQDDLRGPQSAVELLSGEEGPSDKDAPVRTYGPGYALLNLIPSIPTMPLLRDNNETVEAKQDAYATAAKTMAILAHLATVIGIIAVGYWHFDSMKMGIGAATMYLMLPYTAQMTGRIDHVIPAALLVWAVLCYRRPLTTGMFLGLAIGVVYYPIFLLPLWCSFYWQRGLMRFTVGVASILSVMVLILLLVPGEVPFIDKLRQMFGLWAPAMENLDGIWNLGWYAVYRIPILAAFLALSGILALWPAQKNLGTLLSCSGAVMMATQFWHGYGGGLYMAWYLPLLLLTIFRPNLEDRVALTVLGEGWFPRKRLNFGPVDKAA